MTDDLAPLLADGVIDEIVARLKSGKEAEVWLVRHGGEVVAAKVYKARHARNFKNNAAYKEGRQVRGSRTQRAIDRGTRFGQKAAEDAWKAKESDALHRLYAAGVRVPRPVLFYEGTLLMEVVVDAGGNPAPRLVDAQLTREQAATVYADLRKQAVGMLACDLIHGDLSPYNVLVGVNGPVVIDLPQVVDAAHNSQAETFFLRDLQNIQRFCASIDPALRSAEGDGREIWRAYVRRELTADFVPTGRSPVPQRHQSHQSHQAHQAHQSHQAHQPHQPHQPHQAHQAHQAHQPPQDRRRGDAPRGGARPDRHDRRASGAAPQRDSRGPQQASRQRAAPGAGRTGSQPEVVRVVRLDLPRHGAGGGQGGSAGGHGGHGGGAGAHGGHGTGAGAPGGRRTWHGKRR